MPRHHQLTNRLSIANMIVRHRSIPRGLAHLINRAQRQGPQASALLATLGEEKSITIVLPSIEDSRCSLANFNFTNEPII